MMNMPNLFRKDGFCANAMYALAPLKVTQLGGTLIKKVVKGGKVTYTAIKDESARLVVAVGGIYRSTSSKVYQTPSPHQ